MLNERVNQFKSNTLLHFNIALIFSFVMEKYKWLKEFQKHLKWKILTNSSFTGCCSCWRHTFSFVIQNDPTSPPTGLKQSSPYFGVWAMKTLRLVARCYFCCMVFFLVAILLFLDLLLAGSQLFVRVHTTASRHDSECDGAKGPTNNTKYVQRICTGVYANPNGRQHQGCFEWKIVYCGKSLLPLTQAATRQASVKSVWRVSSW